MSHTTEGTTRRPRMFRSVGPAGATDPVIYVMGGTDSVSDAVVAQFKTAAASVATGTVTVKRIAGANRYATAAIAATTPGAVTNSLTLAGGSGATTALFASGEVNADALAGGALSYAWGVSVNAVFVAAATAVG